jgi:ribosomal protein L32
MSPECKDHELLGDICWKCGYIRGEENLENEE